MCDNCKNGSSENLNMQNVAPLAEGAIQTLVQAQSLDTKLTALKLIDALLGKGKIAPWKKPPEEFALKVTIENIVANLVIDRYLREDFHFTPYNTISYILPGHVPLRSEITMNVPGTGTSKAKKGVKRKLPNTDIVYVSDDSDFE